MDLGHRPIKQKQYNNMNSYIQNQTHGQREVLIFKVMIAYLFKEIVVSIIKVGIWMISFESRSGKPSRGGVLIIDMY